MHRVARDLELRLHELAQKVCSRQAERNATTSTQDR
jgi:hypothetical protein